MTKAPKVVARSRFQTVRSGRQAIYRFGKKWTVTYPGHTSAQNMPNPPQFKQDQESVRRETLFDADNEQSDVEIAGENGNHSHSLFNLPTVARAVVRPDAALARARSKARKEEAFQLCSSRDVYGQPYLPVTAEFVAEFLNETNDSDGEEEVENTDDIIDNKTDAQNCK